MRGFPFPFSNKAIIKNHKGQIMKKLFALLTVSLLISACSTTSNDFTQALLKKPEGATSYQCDSGHRIFVWNETKNDTQTATIQYRRDKYTLTRQADSTKEDETHKGENMAWSVNQLTAKLFTVTNGQMSKNPIECCHQVLQ